MPNNKLLNIYRLFDNRFYRIPDYQRGYAWNEKNLNEFWDDLISINNHDHYTGVLTLKNLSKEDLVRCYSEDGNINYENNILSKIKGEIYEVVDGQQRLTTIIILLNTLFYIENFCELKDLKFDRNDFEKPLSLNQIFDIVDEYYLKELKTLLGE